MEGYKTLKAGQDVTFDVIASGKGHHAVNIIPVGADLIPASQTELVASDNKVFVQETESDRPPSRRQIPAHA